MEKNKNKGLWARLTAGIASFALALGVGVALANAEPMEARAATSEYKLTITADDFNTTSYAANNNEKTSNAVNTADSTDFYSVKWTSYQVYQNSSSMQWQKNKGYIYNSTDLGTIKSVTVTSSAGSFTTYYGTSEQPSSGTTAGGGYFKTLVGGATGTSSKLEVVFEIVTTPAESGETPTEYTVTYDANGATSGEAPVDENVYTAGSNATVLDEGNLVKEGYYFAGWGNTATSKTDLIQPGASLPVNSNKILYAIWFMAEPEHITGLTVAEIKTAASASGFVGKTAIYEVTGYVTAWNSGSDGTQYGNFYISDTKGDSVANSVYVYGASATVGAVWSDENAVYSYSNPKDFLTNELTAQIVIGSKITAEFIAMWYYTTFELQGKILSVFNEVDVTGVTASIENGVSYDLMSNDEAAHNIEVVVTPSNATYQDLLVETSGDDLVTIANEEVTAVNGQATVSFTGKGATSGTETIKISAKSNPAKYATITILARDATAPTLVGVTVGGTPTHATQYVGHEFDASGLTFTPVYDKENTNPETITASDIIWSALVAGQHPVGHYGSLEVVVESVNVEEPTVAMIDWEIDAGFAFSVFEGSALDKDHLGTVSALWTDGEISEVNLADCSFGLYDLNDDLEKAIADVNTYKWALADNDLFLGVSYAGETSILDHEIEVVGLLNEIKAEAQGIAEVVYDTTAQGYENAQEITSVDLDGGLTIAFDKGTNSATPKYYTTGTAIRIYGGGYFTVSSTNKIKSISITFGSGDGSNAITADQGSYSNGEWTGDANSVKFSIGGTSGHRRIKTITVQYEGLVSSVISNKDLDAQRAVIAFATAMNTAMNGENVCSGDHSALKDGWDEAWTAYYDYIYGKTYAEAALKMINNAKAQWCEAGDESVANCLERAMMTYDFCVAHYDYCHDNAFLEDRPASALVSNSIFGNANNGNSVMLGFLLVAVAGAAAAGGYLLLRRRKEDR